MSGHVQTCLDMSRHVHFRATTAFLGWQGGLLAGLPGGGVHLDAVSVRLGPDLLSRCKKKASNLAYPHPTPVSSSASGSGALSERVRNDPANGRQSTVECVAFLFPETLIVSKTSAIANTNFKRMIWSFGLLLTQNHAGPSH